MDNLVFVLQGELRTVHKELNGSAATMVDEAVRVVPLPLEFVPLHAEACDC